MIIVVVIIIIIKTKRNNKMMPTSKIENFSQGPHFPIDKFHEMLCIEMTRKNRKLPVLEQFML